MFLPRSTHSTASWGIPCSSTVLQIWLDTLYGHIGYVHRSGHPYPSTCALRPIISNNACPSRITAAAGTRLAGTCIYPTVIVYSIYMGFTTSIAVIPHAISLDQACAQCPIFPTAAARKRLGRVSVPVWPVVLSNQLGIYGLVRLYHTNYLIPRKLIPYRSISRHIPVVFHHLYGADSHVLRTRTPGFTGEPFDLHVLCVSRAFILSQDQTHIILCHPVYPDMVRMEHPHTVP